MAVKRFVIYKQFWMEKKSQKWLEFDSEDEARTALAGLQDSPSAEWNDYYLQDRGAKVTHDGA